MIIYRPMTIRVPQFVGAPLGSWGPRLKAIGKSGPEYQELRQKHSVVNQNVSSIVLTCSVILQRNDHAYTTDVFIFVYVFSFYYVHFLFLSQGCQSDVPRAKSSPPFPPLWPTSWYVNYYVIAELRFLFVVITRGYHLIIKVNQR